MPKRAASPTPEPVPVNVVCALCGEAWHLHAENDGEVSTLECIRLLKLKAQRPTYVPQPYPVYPIRPWYQPYWSISTGTTTGGQPHQNDYKVTINTANEQRTPTVALASATT